MKNLMASILLPTMLLLCLFQCSQVDAIHPLVISTGMTIAKWMGEKFLSQIWPEGTVKPIQPDFTYCVPNKAEYVIVAEEFSPVTAYFFCDRTIALNEMERWSSIRVLFSKKDGLIHKRGWNGAAIDTIINSVHAHLLEYGTLFKVPSKRPAVVFSTWSDYKKPFIGLKNNFASNKALYAIITEEWNHVYVYYFRDKEFAFDAMRNWKEIYGSDYSRVLYERDYGVLEVDGQNGLAINTILKSVATYFKSGGSWLFRPLE
jgi:hypothetical protein